MNLHEFLHLLEDIQKNVPCRGCKESFKKNDIHIIGTVFNEAFFHAECQKCRGHTLIAGLLHEASDHTQNSSAEKGRSHRKLKKSRNPNNLRIINTDDVLDMHNFLKEFNGDFASLFQPKF